MKKLLGLLLAAMLVLSLFSGAAVAESRKEFTFWAAYNPTYQLDWESMKCWKLLEEATGIHINWVLYANSGEMKEKLGVLLGTGTTSSFPDAFFRCSINANQLKKYGPEGLFMDITDLVKEYAPNACAAIDKMDGWSIVSDPSTGEIYSLPCITDSLSGRMLPKLFINVEMMHNVGVDKMPETLDEFYDLLVKVRENDANGNGDPNDEYPININLKYGQGQPLNFAALWGLPITNSIFYKIDENGNVTHAVDTQAFRDFLTYFYRLGQEGLLNLEGLSSTSDQYTAECDAMRSGIFGAWAPSYLITDTANAMQYDGLPKITVPGYEESFCHREFNHANRNAFVISKSCKNVEAALRFYDYISEPTRAIEVFMGEQGIFWDYVDDDYHYEMVYCPSQETDPEGYAAHVQKLIDAGYGDYVEKGIILDGSSLNYYNTVGCVDYGSLVLHAQNYDMTNYADGNVYRIATIRNITERGGYAPAMNTNIVPAEAQEEFDFMCDGLSTVINAFVSESILHGVTDESWNAYLKQLEQYNYDYYIEFFNNKLHNSF